MGMAKRMIDDVIGPLIMSMLFFFISSPRLILPREMTNGNVLFDVQSVLYYTDRVRKKLVLLLAVILLIYFPLSSKASSYDLTIYKTADNSVMGVKEDKLGLDITGYMFIGEDSTEGLYFRVGVQTPFDTILGYLNLFKNDVSTSGDKDNTGSSEKENEINKEETVLDDAALSDDTLTSLPDTLTSSLANPIESVIIDTSESPIINIPESPIIDKNNSPIIDITGKDESTSDQESNIKKDTTLEAPILDNLTKNDSPLNQEMMKDTTLEEDSSSEVVEEPDKKEETKEEIDVGEGKATIDSPQGTAIKGSATKNSFNKEWRLLFTFGPANRRFMGESAIVYLGYGLSGDIGHKVEVEKDTSFTINTSYAVLGADLDFGMRYNLRDSSSIRVGVHFTASLIGVKSQTVLNTQEEEISTNIDIYGYSLSKRGIFETLRGKGYIMLATALGFRKNVTYNYSNTTDKIGGGTITVTQNV